jgi:hypothetical protein
LYRSSSKAGSFRYRERIVEKQRTINKMLKIQPSGQVKSPEKDWEKPPSRISPENVRFMHGTL